MAVKFFIPSTSSELRSYLGVEVETPYGTLECRSVSGVGNDNWTLGFGTRIVKGVQSPEATWSTAHGWESYEERKARVWDEAFIKLPRTQQALVVESFSLEAPKHTLKNPARLVKAAIRNAIRRGELHAKTCGRCGGSGRYSYNQIHGSMCYGCSGTGATWPSATEALKAMRQAKKGVPA